MAVDPRLRNVHILVAEDDRIMLKLVKDMLDIVGFSNILTAGDGKQALDILFNQEVDLLITDWKMQPMDGLELVHHIRNSSESPNRFLPVIMLTGRGERKDVEAARDNGVTEYLVKPFTAAALFERIKRTIDDPRNFVLSPLYRGPDRRRQKRRPPDGKMKRKNDDS